MVEVLNSVAKHWPMADTHQALRQAVKLMRARRYLQHRGIEACAVGSKFEYTGAPRVLT